METQFRLQTTGVTGGGGVVNSVARPLLMPSPGTNSTGQSPSHHRQSRGSIPAYFPETFKDFFSMLTEDEDHGEVITNLLEDKVIPRSPKSGGDNRARDKPRKRCDKPFCCHNSSGGDCGGPPGCGIGSGIYVDSPAYSGGGLTRTLSSKYYRRRPSQPRLLPGTAGESVSSTSHLLDTSLGGNAMTTLNGNNFGRSNSFRLHRPVPSAASTYSSYLSYQQVDRSSQNTNSHNLTCKHVQYCCLHERDAHQERTSGGGGFQQSFSNSSSAPVAPSCSTLSLNERGTATGRLLPRVSQQQQQNQHHHHHHHQNHHQQQNHTQDGINFSDDEKKGLIYPQLTSDSLYMKDRIDCEGGGGDDNDDTFQQHKQRYSLLTKSYDQINRSRVFGEWWKREEGGKVGTKGGK